MRGKGLNWSQAWSICSERSWRRMNGEDDDNDDDCVDDDTALLIMLVAELLSKNLKWNAS